LLAKSFRVLLKCKSEVFEVKFGFFKNQGRTG
jgi:hypothetical protein